MGLMNQPADPAATFPAPPPPAPFGVRALLSFKDGPNRWPVALRAAICMGIPLVAGWLTGDMAVALMASLGAFASLYGSGRPYLNRARFLAVLVLSFACSVTLGMSVESIPLLVVPTVMVIAMVSTYVCSVLRVGGPGAYMITLTCAAGTSMPTAGMTPWQAGLLVFAGGTVAWVVHMVPAAFRPRGPEKHAVAAAGRAVAAYSRAVGTPRHSAAQHQAALALNAAWDTLVTYQPTHLAPDASLNRLRGINRRLHRLFAEIVKDAAHGEPIPEKSADLAVRLSFAAADNPSETWQGGSIPLGAPGPWRALRDGLRPGSLSQLVVLRVGIAALVSGVAAGLLDLERAYWAVAASVLILHAGMDRLRMLQRGFERMAGTWVGLLLAGLVLAIHPQGFWLVLIVMALQFIIEMTVMRNYALAAVFITTVALTIAAGAQQVTNVPELLLARGVDTTIGCLIALLVFITVSPRATPTRIPAALLALFAAVRPVVDFLAANQTGTEPAHEARFKLQTAIFALRESSSTAMGGSTAQRRTAEQSWPAVSTVQTLAYALLSACWLLEQHDGGTPGEAAGAAAGEISADLAPGTGGAEAIAEMLEIFSTAVRDGVKPDQLPTLPRFLRREAAAVVGSLPLNQL